jgi:signal transduction histidine kinase
MQVHALIASSTNPHDAALKPLVAEALQNDSTLTPLENQFSATLGQASRWVGGVLFYSILALTVVLGFGGFMTILYISRLMTQVDKTKSEFVALASHQLRSPLNIINLSIENLKQLGPPRSIEEKDAVEGVTREVRQMASLIKRILDVSRMELGMLVVEPQQTDLAAVAKTEVEALALIAQNKGLHVLESYNPEPCTAHMDPKLLQIIFQNLLSNAIKYTPDGGVIGISVERRPSQILIAVTDTGYGIPKAEQEHIFDRLYRAENATRHDPQGTGLGLYIVKTIVTESGGEIWFTSEEHKGTAFYVSFPPTGMRPSSGTTQL